MKIPAMPRPPSLSTSQARALMGKVYETGVQLSGSVSLNEQRYRTWEDSALDIVNRSFGEDTQFSYTFQNAGEHPTIDFNRPSPTTIESRNRERLTGKLEVLAGQIQALDLRDFEKNLEATDPEAETPKSVVAKSGNVFIVHGHDELNLHRLRTILQDDLGLFPVVLSKKPNQSRHLSTKFTEEAAKCSFAFALLTPDDFIVNGTEGHSQARPNVIFELGWFWGRFEQKNVAIIVKDGTAIPSDLNGITTIRFKDDVSEKSNEIRRELEAANIL